MISSVVLAKRRPDLNLSQFNDHWNTIHGPLIARLDYLRGYTQNMVSSARSLPHGLSVAEVDGIACFYWDDLDAAHRPDTDPEFTEHGKLDEPNFLDLTRLTLIQARPNLFAPPTGPAGLKVIILVARAADVDAESLFDFCLLHWGFSHPGPTGLHGRVVHLAIAAYDEPAPAAVIETWWSEEDDYDAWAESDGANAFFGGKCVDPTRSSIFFASEHHVIRPPGRT